MRTIVTGLILAIALIANGGGTEIPGIINFQGYLTDGTDPLDGTHAIRFRLYDAPSDGTTLWTELRTIELADGYYSVLLGEVTPIEIAFSGGVWISVQITGESEMTPRYRVATMPYAFVARMADSALAVSDNSVTSAKIADGAVGVDDLDEASVTRTKIADGQIDSTKIENASISVFNLSSGGATPGQVLKWTGAEWIPNDDEAGGGSGDGWTDDGSVVRLNSSTDSVGIGTAVPKANLEVLGRIKATQGLEIGNYNSAYSGTSSITGGDSNYVDGSYSLVGSGFQNSNGSYYSVISGGMQNGMIANAKYLTIGGGYNNIIGGGVDSACFIGGGMSHRAYADFATIGGGLRNDVYGYAGFIGGGEWNRADSTHATVGGGYGNRAIHNYSFAGGGRQNIAAGNYATVGGGLTDSALGDYSFIGGGRANVITGSFSFCGAGDSNRVVGDYSVVGGGSRNRADSIHTTVAGGWYNSADYDFATVGGGMYNGASAHAAFVGGGEFNDAQGANSAIAGGLGNVASGTADFVGGGDRNWCYNAGAVTYSTIGGGNSNWVQGAYSTIPGGDSNKVVADYGFAAGCGAQSLHDRSFVWNGGSSAFASSDTGQFLINAPMGVGIGTDSIETPHLLHVAGLAKFDVGSGSIAISTPAGWPGFIAYSNGGNRRDITFKDDALRLVATGSGGIPGDNEGITISNGGDVGIKQAPVSGIELDVNGDIRCISLSETSDARFKTDIAPIVHALDDIMQVEGVRFNWNRETAEGREFADDRQIGLVAQEVEEVFPELVSTDDRGYKSVSYTKMTAVLLQAIKELKTQNDELKTRLDQLESSK